MIHPDIIHQVEQLLASVFSDENTSFGFYKKQTLFFVVLFPAVLRTSRYFQSNMCFSDLFFVCFEAVL